MFRNLCLPFWLSLSLFLSLYLANPCFAAPSDDKTITDDKLPLAEVKRFTKAMELVKKYYVSDISDEKLFENSLRGMLDGLDPHSDYLDEEDYKDLKDVTLGQFGGLGVEVTPEDGFLKIISPIDDSPAEKAGLKPGDLIIRIDGIFVNSLSLRDAVNRMRGPEGTKIRLTIMRKGIKQPLEMRLTRANIQIQSIKAKMLDSHLGYIRISTFQLQTGDELLKAVNALQTQSHGKLQGLILDLRNNPGGLLETAVQVTNNFLDSDKLGYNRLIVSSKGKLASSQFSAKATGKDLLHGAPLVILINNGSASAAEIVAGALQDHKRALLVGTNTFGKGSIQTVLPLDNKRGIKITTALYYTPAGRSIQAQGIKPDLTIADIEIPTPSKSNDEVMLYLKEADLKGHLANSQTSAGNDKNNPNLNTPQPYNDYQLYEAYNLLKGMDILDDKLPAK